MRATYLDGRALAHLVELHRANLAGVHVLTRDHLLGTDAEWAVRLAEDRDGVLRNELLGNLLGCHGGKRSATAPRRAMTSEPPAHVTAPHREMHGPSSGAEQHAKIVALGAGSKLALGQDGAVPKRADYIRVGGHGRTWLRFL